MSGLTTTDPAQLMRIRAEEVLDRGGAVRQAGELAGQFAMMLEQLNGVGDELAATTVQPVSGLSNGPAALEDRGLRLGIGAVSLFAQELAGQAGDAHSNDDMDGFPSFDDILQPSGSFPGIPDDSSHSGNEAAHHIIQGLLSTDSAQNTDFRWLATLFSSVEASSDEAPQV